MNAPTLHQPASDLARLLFSDGVIRDPAATMIPLSGGVSSEIYLVNDGGRQFRRQESPPSTQGGPRMVRRHQPERP